MTMTVVELLEATKHEVDKRWEYHSSLWASDGEGCCILGCLGFARWEDFRERHEWHDNAYHALSSDPVTGVAIGILAGLVEKDYSLSRTDMAKVYSQNDHRFKNKADAKDFIDLALRGLTEGTT